MPPRSRKKTRPRDASRGPTTSGGKPDQMNESPSPRLPRREPRSPDFRALLTRLTGHGVVSVFRKNQVVFAQGDLADAVFYVQKGEVKLTVVSSRGKAAIIAVLRAGDFVGEGCLAGQPLRMATAAALTETATLRISKSLMANLLQKDAEFSEVFVAYLLSRTIRVEEDLVDQLFNSSEKRLARMLLLLAGFGKQHNAELVIPRVSQEALAEMIGTTRARVSGFMNKFRRLGLIEYNGGLRVHDALMNVIVHD